MKSCDILLRSQTRIDLLFTMSEIPQARPVKDDACEVMFSRTINLAIGFSPSSPKRATPARFALRPLRGCATRSPNGEAWWSQTGSNRRPHACKARALPAELWPRTRRRMLRSIKVVGLGRLELPTSRLSSARSNQLSYKPPTRGDVLARTGLTPDASRSPWRVFVREKRKTRTAKSRQCSSTILTTVGH